MLDEAANIAPVRDLDTLASTGAGLGVQLVTVCQDLAQLAARYGPERARTIANNHRAKLLLSRRLRPGHPRPGLRVSPARQPCARRRSPTTCATGARTRSSAMAFRRLAPDRRAAADPARQGVLVYGHLPPVRLRLRPWYRGPPLADPGRDEPPGAATLTPAGVAWS